MFKVITWFLYMGGPVPAVFRVRGRCDYRRMVEEMCLAVLKLQGGALEAECGWVASKRWKRQGNRFSSRALGRMYPC